MASESNQPSFDPSDLHNNDEEYITSKNVAETIPGTSDHAVSILAAAKLYLNS